MNIRLLASGVAVLTLRLIGPLTRSAFAVLYCRFSFGADDELAVGTGRIHTQAPIEGEIGRASVNEETLPTGAVSPGAVADIVGRPLVAESAL